MFPRLWTELPKALSPVKPEIEKPELPNVPSAVKLELLTVPRYLCCEIRATQRSNVISAMKPELQTLFLELVRLLFRAYQD